MRQFRRRPLTSFPGSIAETRQVGLSCKALEGFTVSMLCMCVAVPRGMEELWQLCCTVHLWWQPGSLGSQWKQQSIIQLSCLTGGMHAHTRMNAHIFPTIYHAWPGILLLPPVSLSLSSPLTWLSHSEPSLLAYWSPPLLFFFVLPCFCRSGVCIR